MVSYILREATHDDVIPLQHAVRGRDGKTHDSIAISAGQEVVVTVTECNRSAETFGDDASAFDPERWLGERGRQLREHASTTGVSVLNPLLSFIGGNRSEV